MIANAMTTAMTMPRRIRSMSQALPMARVVVTRRLPFAALESLRSAHDVLEWRGDSPPSAEELRPLVVDAEGILCLLTDRIDAAFLDAAPKLRVISNYAVGADNVDLEEARRRDIAV